MGPSTTLVGGSSSGPTTIEVRSANLAPRPNFTCRSTTGIMRPRKLITPLTKAGSGERRNLLHPDGLADVRHGDAAASFSSTTVRHCFPQGRCWALRRWRCSFWVEWLGVKMAKCGFRRDAGEVQEKSLRSGVFGGQILRSGNMSKICPQETSNRKRWRRLKRRHASFTRSPPLGRSAD